MASVGADYLGRQALNSIFGDRIVASRLPDVLVQFQYGISDRDIVDGGVASGTGAGSASGAVATLTSGAGVGEFEMTSRRSIRYQPGFDAYGQFTLAMNKAGDGSFQMQGIGDANNSFYVGQKGGVFGYGFISGGFDTFIPVVPGSPGEYMQWGEFDPAMLNIFRINYGWLGVAPDFFEVYSGSSRGGWHPVGVVEVLNTQVVPSIVQPVQPMFAKVGRTSGEGEVIIRTCSWSGGRISSAGSRLPSDRRNSLSVEKSSVTTEVNLLTIRNNSTFAGLVNRIGAEVIFMSAAADGTKPAYIRPVRNATLGGTPDFNEVDAANSVLSYDTEGTTVTGGAQEPFAFNLSATGADKFFLTETPIELLPGDTLTFAGRSNNSTNLSLDVSVVELF